VKKLLLLVVVVAVAMFVARHLAHDHE